MIFIRFVKISTAAILMISLILVSLFLPLPLSSPSPSVKGVVDGVSVQSKDAVFKLDDVDEKRREINRTYVVTLVTGDMVTVGVTKDNRTVVLSVTPHDPTRFNRGFRILEDERGVYVIPSDVDLRKADLNLFNVKYLVDEEYYKLHNTPLIVELSKKIPPAKALAALQLILNASKGERITRSYRTISATSVQVSPGETFYKFLSSDYIGKIWLNYRVRVLLYESAPLIGASEVWDLGYNGSGIKIAILDTGIDPTHPLFYFSNGTSKIIDQVDFTNDKDPYDYFGHGTHVASIAAGTELSIPSLYSYTLEYAPSEWFDDGEPMGWHADDYCWELSLPFPFPFYGVNYTRIYVSSNGLISFLGPDTAWRNSIEGLAVRKAIAVAWDDWRTDMRPGDDIYIWQPDSNSLAIRWRVVAFYDNSIEANFGVVLYSNGTIKCFYGYNNAAISATIGISNGSGDIVAENVSSINYIDTRIFKPYVHYTPFIRGIAPGALLMNVKVLNREGWGWLDWVIAGVEYATLGPDGNPNTGDEADILSLSLGATWWTDGTDPLSMACDIAVDLGRIVVVAAGNWGDYFRIGVPATARKVITVGASDKLDSIAYFSSKGPTVDFRIKPDLVAPGVNILAALAKNSIIEYWADMSWVPGMDVDGDGRYDLVSLSGTSMATPHVSGAAALVKQARQLDPIMIKNLLISTSKDLGYDVYVQGSGRLNVLAAIKSDILVSPATVSLGLITKNTTYTYNFNLTFINVGSKTIGISLHPSLTRVWYGGDYSSLVSLNVTELSLLPGESKGVMVTINTAGLPAGYYSGLINTNYTVASSNLHVIFGLAVFNRIDITFYGLDGATPIQYALVGAFRANATKEEVEIGYPVNWILSFTDEYGRATLYVFDGLHYIVGTDWGKKEYCDAYSIVKIWINGSLNVTLSLEGAHRISYDPPAPNQIISWLSNGIFYIYYNSTYNYGYGWGIVDYIYYPLTTDIYITSTDLVFYSGYQHYDKRYVNVPDPSVLIAPELYSTIFVNKSITGSKTVSFNSFQLTRVEKKYKVALTPPISAGIFRATDIYFEDWYYLIWTGGIQWSITSPKTLTEYLGWDIPPHIHPYYYVGYYKKGDLPNVSTPYFEFEGFENYWETGIYLLDVNSHPLDPDIYIGIWSYEDGNRAILLLFSDLFCERMNGAGYYSYNCLDSDSGLVTVKRNGTVVYYGEIYDYLGFWTEIDLPAKIEIDLGTWSNMYLSTEATLKVEFEVPVGGSMWLYNPFSLMIKGLDLNNTHPGGDARGFIYYNWVDVRNITLEYSLDDGKSWNSVTLSEEPGYYGFTLPRISDRFVSLRIDSTIENGFKVRYTVIRGFYVKPLAGIGRLRVETIPPVPTRIFLDGIVRNSWGLDWVRIPAGYYNLSFSDVPYRETPKYVKVIIWPGNITAIVPLSEPIPIYPNKTTEVKAYFEPLGSLRIQTEPPVPVTIYIDGIPRNEWGLWVDIEPGNYTISFEPYPGYKTPPPIVVNVERGKLTHVIGNYTSGTTIIIESP